MGVGGQGRRPEAGGKPYPTRRYPGTVLVFPLSRMSNTAVSAAPRGTNFTHMRFFLDTEASGSGGSRVRRGKSKEGTQRWLQDDGCQALLKAGPCMVLGQWLKHE